MNGPGRLFIIDGHALIFKMYYAFLRHPMINTRGEDTSILFGFIRYLLELVEKEHPTHLAVAFDPPAKTFRHEIYPQYKANRLAAPEQVKAAFEPLCEILRELDIPVFMVPGYEADDVIGTVALSLASDSMDVYMVTPDKDYGQLVGDHVFQFKPGKSGSENELMTSREICEKYGISSPAQVVDILAVWGDSADNVKGVDGVGEVGARKLVGLYGSVQGIYDHIGELTPKLRASFEAARDHIPMSRFLVTIKTDVPLDIDASSLEYSARLTQGVRDLFRKYEFDSLLRFLGDAPQQTAPSYARAEYVESTPSDVARAAEASGRVAISTTGRSLAACSGNLCAAVSFEALASSPLSDILGNPFVAKTGHGLKRDIVALARCGIKVEGELLDIELMHYVINPERTHKLDILSKGYLNTDLSIGEDAAQETAAPDLFSMMDEPGQGDSDLLRALRETSVMEAIAEKVEAEMAGSGVVELYRNIEEPLIKVLASMEHNGVKIDVPQLRRYGMELSAEAATHEQNARQMAEDPSLNLASVRQVGTVLYEKLQLNPKAKKSARANYPTDEQTLLELADKHPIINEILEYRAARKLQSTYTDPLPGLIDPSTGRIHTTFNQALTATGRLSSTHPNLQNIPIRSEQGREIRKAFIASDPEGCIVAADYSQIELRLMAHCSGDANMTEAFNRGMDIHTATAAKVFHVAEEEVTKEQRRRAKVANFGIIYGISAFGLAQRMGIPRGEARQFIDNYFETYPAVREYMDRMISLCREQGYVSTVFNRRRYLPDINSRNANVRAFAERNAINAPIQGSAADIIKMAMVNVHRAVADARLRSRMVLQVHDELVFDVVAGEREAIMEIVKREMESVCTLSVPLIAECSYGGNWLEAH